MSSSRDGRSEQLAFDGIHSSHARAPSSASNKWNALTRRPQSGRRAYP